MDTPVPTSTANMPSTSRWARFRGWLFGEEPAVALAVFRILWGGLMAWESWRYLARGWVESYYIAPTFLFKYVGFEWVQPLGATGITTVWVAMILAAVMVSLGLAYRAASVAFFLAHTYVFLLGAANYLNHAYLISLLAAVMIVAPAHRTLSLDALLRTSVAAKVVPRWTRALIRVQLGVVYVYGALAKLNSDWIVYHQPVRRWMQTSADRVMKTPWLKVVDHVMPVTQHLHDIVASEPFTIFVAYGGVVFDLLITPALLWRKTRRIAVVAAVAFHVSNMHLFSIGVFPWLMLASIPLFFEPDWVERIPKVGQHVERVVEWLTRRGDGGVRVVRHAGPWAVLWVAWVVVQVLVPLRHHLYPGDVAWTEEGHNCAWRMKLRSKRGSVMYRVVDTVSKETWTVDPAEELTERQARKIRGKPELIRQYAAHLVTRYREDEGRVVQVYAEAFTSLNYREPQRFIDPQHEIGHEPASWGPYAWVLPMQWTPPPHPEGTP